MNSETAILIAIGLAVLIMGLAFAFSQGVLNSAEDTLIGPDEGGGVINCDPTQGDKPGSCTENSGYDLKKSEPGVKI